MNLNEFLIKMGHKGIISMPYGQTRTIIKNMDGRVLG